MPEPVKDWRFELPKFWDSSLFRKIPISEDGMSDIIGRLNDLDSFSFDYAIFGSLSPERKIGIGQEYRKIGEEDLICLAMTFFNEEEPSLLYWIKESEPPPFSVAIRSKKDDTWLVVRPPEELRLEYVVRSVAPAIFEEIDLIIYNLVTEATVIRVGLKRGSDG